MSSNENKSNPNGGGGGKFKFPLPDGSKMKRPNWIVIIIYAAIIVGLVTLWSTSGSGNPVKKEWFEVRDDILPTGSVSKVVYIRNTHRGEVYVKSSAADRYKNYFPENDQPRKGPYFYFLVSDTFNAEEEFDAVLQQMPELDRFEVVVE